MPVVTGTQLGPYQILSAIGAGGMGEVYKARDARLGREVAIKVLPEDWANHAERRARFERESQNLILVESSPYLHAVRYRLAGRLAFPGDGTDRR